MDPRFECPFCGKVVRYDSEAGNRSVTLKGAIRFPSEAVEYNATFCDLLCLLAYIEKWEPSGE